MNRWFVIAIALLAMGCATVEQRTTSSRPLGSEAFASVGDIILRVEVAEDLPNLFGRADVFGRSRNRGFSELRYMGLSPDGHAVFRRRDVDVITNEDTMNRTGFGSATVVVQPSGRGIVAYGVGGQAPPPDVDVLPADTIQFTLNLSSGNVITIRDRTILVNEATGSGVRFSVR